MHIALLCEYGTVNGGENSILAMIEELPAMTFTVLAPPAGRLAERLAEANLRHVPLSLHDSEGTRLPREVALQRIESCVAEIQPDLLHANSLAMGRLTGAAGGSLDCPTSAHLRDILKLNRSTIADLNRNDALVAVSQQTREHHLGQGLDPARTEVIYNGINTSDWYPRAATGALHAELQRDPSTPLIAAVGQISLRKGQDLLIAAACQAASVVPQAQWLIVGERYSRKAETVTYERKLREQVHAAGLSDRVHWLGYREDIRRLLSELTLLVHPARQEPLGRVLLEAGACGVATIATNVGGTAEIIDDGRSGILVAPDDATALAAAVVDLLQDDDRRSSLARFASETIPQRFAIPSRAAELADLWQRLINRRTDDAAARPAGHRSQ